MAWDNHLLSKGPGGRAGVGQAQIGGHIQASMAAHAAASRAKVAQVLSGGAGTAQPATPATPGGPSFKQHIAHAMTAGGLPTTPHDVLGAISDMHDAGHFTTTQATGLMQHNGALHGPQGLATMAKIGAHIASSKGPQGMPPMEPQA